MKICLAASVGGHLTQIMRLETVYRKRPHFFITFYTGALQKLSDKEKVFFVRDTKRNPINFLINFFQSLKIFLQERPDVVISTGAGVAIPICLLAKLAKRKVIFIEEFCRVYSPSISGRICYYISDLFIVQWEFLKRYYPRAKFVGTLL